MISRVLRNNCTAAHGIVCWALKRCKHRNTVSRLTRQLEKTKLVGSEHLNKTIISVTEWNMVFVYTALPYALSRVADFLDARLKIFDRQTWEVHCNAMSRSILSNATGEIFLIIEAAYLQRCPHVNAIRQNLAISKIVVLGGDTVYSLPKCEFNGCESVDLFLDLVAAASNAVSVLFRIPTAVWAWTPSRALLIAVKLYAEKIESAAPPRFKVVMLHSVHGDYRRTLVEHIEKSGFVVEVGRGGGDTRSLSEIFLLYASSFAAIGTTSSSNSQSCRSMKGFRDWIAPHLGALLIYDNYPDVLARFPCLTYNYSDLSSLSDIIHSEYAQRTSSYFRQRMLESQKRWVERNTLDAQLLQALRVQLGVDVEMTVSDKASYFEFFKPDAFEQTTSTEYCIH